VPDGTTRPIRPILLFVGGLRYQEPCTDAEEGGGALSHHSGRSKRTHDDAVKGLPVGRIPARDLRSLLHNPDATIETALHDRAFQESGSALVGLEQHHRCRGPLAGDNETREAATRPKVEQPRVIGARLGACNPHEALGVKKVALDGAGTQKAGLTGLEEHLLQGERGSPVSVGVRHRRLSQPAGAMTM
jgi:hypothetical protein